MKQKCICFIDLSYFAYFVSLTVLFCIYEVKFSIWMYMFCFHFIYDCFVHLASGIINGNCNVIFSDACDVKGIEGKQRTYHIWYANRQLKKIGMFCKSLESISPHFFNICYTLCLLRNYKTNLSDH